jgi:hypothetical protein
MSDHSGGRIEQLRRLPAVRAQADALTAQLDALLERIVPYKYGYARTPEEWRAARGELYGLAVAGGN